VATQNPFDAAGTFPLPHSQLDRFLLRVALGYPDRSGEDELLAGADARPLPEALPETAGASYVLAFASVAVGLHVSAAVRGYILDLVEATRQHADLVVGASPRAGLAVLRASRALAVAEGRSYVLPDDVKRIAVPALAHRVVAHPAVGSPGAAAAVVGEIVARLPVPIDVGHR
jgi:MoxR-like ATPase